MEIELRRTVTLALQALSGEPRCIGSRDSINWSLSRQPSCLRVTGTIRQDSRARGAALDSPESRQRYRLRPQQIADDVDLRCTGLRRHYAPRSKRC